MIDTAAVVVEVGLERVRGFSSVVQHPRGQTQTRAAECGGEFGRTAAYRLEVTGKWFPFFDRAPWKGVGEALSLCSLPDAGSHSDTLLQRLPDAAIVNIVGIDRLPSRDWWNRHMAATGYLRLSLHAAG